MADLISREKEFRKLNEQLDSDYKRSTTLSKIEKIRETRQNPLTSICYDTYRVKNMGGGNTDRFATFTKEKCTTINSMRKVGGGDCAPVPIKPKSPTSPKSKTTKASYGNTFHNRAKSLPKGATGGIVSVAKQHKIGIEEFNSTKSVAPASMSSRRTAPKDALVVYKNENFTCSSSMDDIIKRNLTEPAEVAKESKTRTIASDYINDALPPRSETTQAQHMESLGSSGAKSSQKMVNTSSLIRFLKSKVTLLEENQARNVEEMSKQKEAYEATIDRNKSLTQQLDKALNRNSALTDQLEKTNSQLIDANQRFREKSQECLSLKKELETVQRELKHLSLNYTNLEKRFTRTKEETENAQKSCTNLRQNERDIKESFRRETEAKNAEIKYLKKQRSDLFTAYKKQLFLIDNLRQQNICMEQAKMIDFCEKEFSKILEWNLKA